MEDFANWLEEKLKERGWQPSDLAHKAHLGNSTVTRILNSNRGAGPEVCVAIARTLQLPPELVFRKAGLLPSQSESTPDLEELSYLFEQLEEEKRQLALVTLRAWVSHPLKPNI
ncbi:MAG: helix-turn-helix transcriptional regulator [Anaerolineae bacterium]|nr:helix-turn-helix transcriptional regulator [Anaerolineae bacterium]